jgi:serine/threonine protein kinase
MEICERGEIFVEKGDDAVFDHTKIIFRANDEYFYAKTSQRLSSFQSSAIDIDRLEAIRIPSSHIFPLADPKFTQAPNPLPPTSYLKQPKLLYYGLDDVDYSNLVLTEVEACEVLRRHPHPNIATYLGCTVKDGRITGLAFAKYPLTLSQMVRDGLPFDKERCLSGIESGLRHMHSLGLIHNDLNPANVMVDGDTAVIIDFDSCKREGDKLGSKAGTDGWTLDGQEYARRENDWHSLSKIRVYLEER